MPNGDDLDARFNELVAQIDEDERRRMRAAATRGARAPRSDKATRPRRAGRGLLAAGLVAAVIGGATVIVAARPDLLTPQVGSPGPVPEETQPVMAAPEVAALGEGTTADPFKGSAAEKYAAGVAGLVMPPAKALGGMKKEDVAKGLERTRDMLAASFFDRKALMGGEPTALMKLVDPEQRDDRWRAFWSQRFAPGTAELVTDVIKVHGEATLSESRFFGRPGVAVAFNYLIVYAIRRPGEPATTTRLVSHSDGRMLIYRERGRLVTWVDRWGSAYTPAHCDANDAFIHPYYDDSEPDKVKSTGAPLDPYDLSWKSSGDGGCLNTEGT